MCIAQGPQRSDAGEARTHGHSVSSQADETVYIHILLLKMSKKKFGKQFFFILSYHTVGITCGCM